MFNGQKQLKNDNFHQKHNFSAFCNDFSLLKPFFSDSPHFFTSIYVISRNSMCNLDPNIDFHLFFLFLPHHPPGQPHTNGPSLSQIHLGDVLLGPDIHFIQFFQNIFGDSAAWGRIKGVSLRLTNISYPSILNLPFFLEKMEKVKNLMPSKALGVREVRGHLSSTTMK